MNKEEEKEEREEEEKKKPEATEAEAARAAEAKEQPEADGAGLRLTDRDRQLMGLLATVRALSTEQLCRLLYPERSAFNLKKRLRALAGVGRHGLSKPYLERVTYRSWEGRLQCAWTPTELGYVVAETVLPDTPKVPTAEVGAAFIEHHLMLNELYVQLLQAPLKAALLAARVSAQRERDPARALERLKAPLYARASTPAFRWHASDTVRLPWRQYDETSGKTRDRLILPDAVLELPERGRRYFLECETGSHSLVAASDEKRGTTVAKLERYEEYVFGLAGNGPNETHYRANHPDGYALTVLLLVRNAARQASVNRAITDWRQGRAGQPLRAQALTVELAAAEFLRMLGQSPAAAPPPVAKPKREVVSGEVRLVRGFYISALASLKTARARARARQEPVPAYPQETDEVRQLLEKLAASR
jgi:hypothetical protein